jgi:flagellar hook-associated protein 3 FlgL
MISLGHSDMASSMKLAEQNFTIKASMETVSSELSSGKKANLIDATAGDLGKLFAIDRTLLRLESKGEAVQLAGGKAAATQAALGNIHDNLMEIGPQLLSAVERRNFQSSTLIAADARHALGAVVVSINSRYGRHSIFAGAAVDQQAIGSAEEILNDVSVIVASSVDSASAILAIDDYFYNAGGGFETNIFRGSSQDAPPLHDENGVDVQYGIRADEPEIRNVLRALAIAAVASEAPNFLGTTDQIDLLREAGMSTIAATGSVIVLRETLGFAEGRIEGVRARTQAMHNILELERFAIVSADPYETATKFEALNVQLQTIYTITARLSGLSLINYLR